MKLKRVRFPGDGLEHPGNRLMETNHLRINKTEVAISLTLWTRGETPSPAAPEAILTRRMKDNAILDRDREQQLGRPKPHTRTRTQSLRTLQIDANRLQRTSKRSSGKSPTGSSKTALKDTRKWNNTFRLGRGHKF